MSFLLKRLRWPCGDFPAAIQALMPIQKIEEQIAQRVTFFIWGANYPTLNRARQASECHTTLG